MPANQYSSKPLLLGRVYFIFLNLFFWTVFFEAARLVFVLFHFNQIKQLPVQTTLLTFLYGLRMDLSAAGYVVAPLCLFVLIGLVVPFFRKAIVYNIYDCLLLFILLLLIVTDLETYKEWGFRVDASILKYLHNPKEAWASVGHLPVFLILFSLLVVYLFLCFVIYWFNKRIAVYLQQCNHVFISFLIALLATACLIIPIRGGFQMVPINQSSVYFSSSNYANVAAINPAWNFVRSASMLNNKHNPYTYLSAAQCKTIVDSLYADPPTAEYTKLIGAERPLNIIYIIWESFTEKATHINVNGIEVTPGFNALKKEGIYFSNVYASGERTEKALGAVFSGYPALPQTSIVRYPEKSSKLPAMPELFRQKGYNTPFYYGGEPEYANFKSYLLHAGFFPIVSKSAFNEKDMNSTWGANDAVVASRILHDMPSIKQPFFLGWLTLSSHEPYDVPMTPVFKGKDEASLFLNSLHYADSSVNYFIQQCKQQPWWQNTLVIIMADHGHRQPETNRKWNDFKIPMLWLGGALQQKGIVIDKTVSQLDIPATLLQQFDMPAGDFPFSKNIMNPSIKQWAFFTFNNGFGLMQPDKKLVFDNAGKQVIEQEGPVTNKDMEAGKALQQYSYQDFLDK